MRAEQAIEREKVQEAVKRGMRSLRDDGWDKVLAGTTTVEEAPVKGP